VVGRVLYTGGQFLEDLAQQVLGLAADVQLPQDVPEFFLAAGGLALLEEGGLRRMLFAQL
jgi:hypothetical protein